MKKLFILLITCVLSINIFAQNAALTNAILYQRDGDLVSAKKYIDQAAAHEKTINLAKTWYTKGLIYADIYKSDKVEVKQLDIDPLKTSTEALLKTIELDTKKGEYFTLASELIKENRINLVNRGIANYQSKKYEEAISLYDMAHKIVPEDTTTLVYAAYAADALRDDKRLIEYTDKLLKLNNKSIFTYISNLNSNLKLKQYQNVINVSNQALTEFPNQTTMLQIQTLAYIESGKTQEGLDKLSVLLQKQPYDIELITNAAIYNNALKNYDKCLEYYNKIIAIEPYHQYANYNGSVINFNKGKELYQKNDVAGSKIYFQRAIDMAKRAKINTQEDAEVDNLQRIINEAGEVVNKK